jgi:exopolyphosphatase/guanosine-5'-triphosphate,3'-diphosphate pyrophosphatase
VATSAVRDARNRDVLLDAIAELGFEPRLLSGAEEAETAFRGVLSSQRGAAGAGVLVIDVGGGSTEIVLGGAPGQVAFGRSYPLGCVRMTERFTGEDVVDEAAQSACREAARTVLADVPDGVVEATRRAIGVAGTVTTLAALDLRLAEYDAQRIHGHRVARESLADWRARLCALPLARRREQPGLEPERAPVICAGLLVLEAVLDRFSLRELEASERDILHGAALAVAGAAPAWHR